MEEKLETMAYIVVDGRHFDCPSCGIDSQIKGPCHGSTGANCGNDNIDQMTRGELNNTLD